MGIEEVINGKRAEVLRLAREHGASNVRVFGSVARGEAGPGSDVDFLVDLEAGQSLMDHVALIQDLQELLDRKVDLGINGCLHWFI